MNLSDIFIYLFTRHSTYPMFKVNKRELFALEEALKRYEKDDITGHNLCYVIIELYECAQISRKVYESLRGKIGKSLGGNILLSSLFLFDPLFTYETEKALRKAWLKKLIKYNQPSN